MNKRWLIKINNEDNLYYDSENKEYRLRLFCPACHKPSECQCYQDYGDYERDCVTEFPVRCCSYLCCLVINSDGDTENIIEAAKSIGIEIKQFTKYTEEDAKQIIDYLIDEGAWDFQDESSGEQCQLLPPKAVRQRSTLVESCYCIATCRKRGQPSYKCKK